MVYHVIGLMSGSSLDGLDVAYVSLTEVRGQWTYEVMEATCVPYDNNLKEALRQAVHLQARDYVLLNTHYGKFIGEQVNQFIAQHQLEHRIHFIASHGHTTFHLPSLGTTEQIGCGATIAALTKLPVISDLRALDVALGGQGAPIVPIGERLLFPGYAYYLNLGGIANLTRHQDNTFVAFDVAPANRILDICANKLGRAYDVGGALAAGGILDSKLLDALQALPYYQQPFPKSLANDFGTDVVWPLIEAHSSSVQSKLHTYVHHLVYQIKSALIEEGTTEPKAGDMLVTGGGAFNTFLMEQLQAILEPFQVRVVVPDSQTVQYKEAIVMALIGALRWRQEPNVLHSVTGASRDSIGGALWLGDQ
jgi:anhydro-N-acetylmuramic acid kinase